MELPFQPGEHTITVENIGNDWFMVGYRFVNLVKRTGPALQGWAIEGNNTVVMWVRPEGRTWRRVIVDKVPFPSVEPSQVSLDGLASGDWRMEVWDTWKGSPISTSVIHVGVNGKARLPIPVVVTDLAVKLMRVGSPRRDK